MKTYVATVCLTKSYTDKMCNQVLLQKEFPDEKAAHVWLNKALKRYNYVKGIKDLCYVSWFSLDDENGNQLLYFDYFSSDVPHEIQVRVTLTKKYPAQKHLKSAPQIIMSWGYHQPSVYKEDGMEGLRFRVQGFKHTGYVAVLYNPGSDYFEVELQDDMGHAKTRVEDVCFTELVDKIDELVERTDNYDADIEVWKNTPESDPDKQAAKDLGKLVCELQELGIGGDIIIID